MLPQRVQPAHKQRVQNRLRVVQKDTAGRKRAHIGRHGRELARIQRAHHLLNLVVAVRMNHAWPVQKQIRQHADKKHQRTLPSCARAGRVRQHLHPVHHQRKQRPVKRIRAQRRDANRYKIESSRRKGDVSVQKQPRNDMNSRHRQCAHRAANALRPALRARKQKKKHQRVHTRVNQRIRKKTVRQIRFQARGFLWKRAQIHHNRSHGEHGSNRRIQHVFPFLHRAHHLPLFLQFNYTFNFFACQFFSYAF